MNLECKDIGLKIELSDKLLDYLYVVGMKHYPNEFGGLLIGHYSDNMKTCIVSECVLPKKYKSSRYYFERGLDGLKETLLNFHESDPSLIYIGEWHTHPDMPSEPSETDKKAIREIAEHDDVNITSPLLLILSNNQQGYSFSCYVQFKKQLYKYEQ